MDNKEPWFTKELLQDHISSIGNGGGLRSAFKTADSNPNAPKVSLESAKKRLAARKQRRAAKLNSERNETELKKKMTELDIVDVGSEESILGAALSNFEAYSFVFDGVVCHSMEGLIQSFKFDDVSKQRDVCLLIGKKAKYRGKKRKWFRDGYLYWGGSRYDRFGEDYQCLLDKAFDALATNVEFQRALLNTGGAKLTHSQGKSDPCFTILTINEFCDRLTTIRAKLLPA